MADRYTVKEGFYGPRLVLQANWSTEISDYIVSAGIRELELNRALGWKDKDLSFLPDMPAIDAIAIVDWRIEDISRIHSLHFLKGLQLSTEDKTAINFDRFPNLERCGINWRPGSESLFDRTSLKWLFLHRYKGKNLSRLGNLAELQYLNISVAPIDDLRGLKPLQKLRYLGMHYLTKLVSLKGIEQATSLEELEITHCNKITSITEIGHLKNLKSLNIGDNRKIDSILPLRSLKKIESLFFYGSTNIVDGDLSPLRKMNNLVKLSFQDRKHYSFKKSDFRFE